MTAALEPSLTVQVCPTNVGRAVTQTVTRILIYRYVSEAGAATSTACIRCIVVVFRHMAGARRGTHGYRFGTVDRPAKHGCVQ